MAMISSHLFKDVCGNGKPCGISLFWLHHVVWSEHALKATFGHWVYDIPSFAEMEVVRVAISLRIQRYHQLVNGLFLCISYCTYVDAHSVPCNNTGWTCM